MAIILQKCALGFPQMDCVHLTEYDANSNSKKAPPISLEIVSWLKERTSQQEKDSSRRAVPGS